MFCSAFILSNCTLDMYTVQYSNILNKGKCPRCVSFIKELIHQQAYDGVHFSVGSRSGITSQGARLQEVVSSSSVTLSFYWWNHLVQVCSRQLVEWVWIGCEGSWFWTLIKWSGDWEIVNGYTVIMTEHNLISLLLKLTLRKMVRPRTEIQS